MATQHLKLNCIAAGFAMGMSLVVLPCWASETVRIGGTGNALGAIRVLAEAFNKEHPDTKITVLDSIGTSGAIRAVPKKAIEIGLSSRQLTDTEAKEGIRTVEYARTLTVFAVRAGNPTESVTNAEIADLYNGNRMTWADGTPVRPILRQAGDDNTRQVTALSPLIAQALERAEKRQGIAFAVTDQESADKAESIAGSFSISTLSLILSESRKLKPLTLNGVAPNLDTLANGQYPLVKHFYFVLPATPTAGATGFMNFVASPKGRAILHKNGLLPP